jgi:hypothetical protein
MYAPAPNVPGVIRAAGTAPDDSVPILVKDDETMFEGSIVPTVSLATSSPEAMKALAIAEPFQIPDAIVPRYEVPETERLVDEALVVVRLEKIPVRMLAVVL